MDTLFWGEAQNAFFSFNDMDVSRVISMPIYPKPFYSLLKDKSVNYKEKVNGEIRVLGVDIATQGGSKNDNTCFSLLQLLPTDRNQYIRNVMYVETLNGGHTYDQSVRIKQLYDDLDCDFVVLDCLNAGVGIFDMLVMEIADEERGVLYPAWTCMNDKVMAERCKDPDAPEVIYSVKANQQFNNDAAVYMRDCLRRGKLRLLINEADATDHFSVLKSYEKLSIDNQSIFTAPFYQTSLLINETINLSHEVVNGKIRVQEQGGMRKDRYSSVSYANVFANIKERELRADQKDDTFKACVSSVSF